MDLTTTPPSTSCRRDSIPRTGSRASACSPWAWPYNTPSTMAWTSATCCAGTRRTSSIGRARGASLVGSSSIRPAGRRCSTSAPKRWAGPARRRCCARSPWSIGPRRHGATTMCGIFGLFNTDASTPADVRVLDRMGEVLAHRGPDGGGVYTDHGFGMGMRRLSIIDLKTGDQPLANEDGSVWVVFNGEIYNYRELTAELLAKGHRFATASDTEVLVHLYEEYGEECVGRLRGMFAFAIWDRSRGTLFLARDRLGIKPLYYAETPKGFVFASELKAIVKSPWVSPQLSQRALRAYLQFGYVPDPLSILEGVAKLRPGHTLTIRERRAGSPRPYWNSTASFRDPIAPSREEEAGEALWTLLQDAVRSHLVSDVPLGAFLSGGVDSTTVVAIMAQELGVPIKTFSVGFREEGYNELPYARRVAERFGTEHHELLVEPEHLGVLEDVLSALDEPFAD